MKNNYSLKLMLLVAISGIVGFKATFLHLDWLKYLTVIIQLYALTISIKIIIANKIQINWGSAFPVLAVISGYPFLSMLLNNVVDFDFKKMTDGFFVFGVYYYQLPIIAMALAIEFTKNQYVLETTLCRYVPYAIPIAIFLVYSSATDEISSTSVGGFFAVSDCIIPMCLLAFHHKAPKKYYYLGLLSVIALFVFSSQLNARSYLLVSSYIIVALLIITYKNSKKSFLYLAAIGPLFLIYILIPSLSVESYAQEGYSSMDVLQLDTLSEAIGSFLNTLDFSYLFYWEGNSRAGILEDAFGDFSINDWLFGRGIYGTYMSFIERSTIELGWAQECFFWGILYVFFKLYIFIYGLIYFWRQSIVFRNRAFECLGILILVRLLDGFIYGMPEFTVYNLLVFSGIMMRTIKTKPFMRLAK